MKSIKTNKQALIAKLKENKTKHILEFTEAMVGYRKTVVIKLGEAIKLALDGKDVPYQQMYSDISDKPESHEHGYNVCIQMLEMSVEDNVEITAQEFNNYVLDNWDWKASFAQTYNKFSNIG